MLDRLLEVSAYSSIDEPVVVQRFYDDPDFGFLTAALGYENGRLDIRLVVAWIDGYPAWRRYAFPYADGEGQLVFRHDDFPHTDPADTHYPHHVHIGQSPEEIVRGCFQPGLRDIGERVSDHLRGRPQH